MDIFFYNLQVQAQAWGQVWSAYWTTVANLQRGILPPPPRN